jgi:hypothetical protein
MSLQPVARSSETIPAMSSAPRWTSLHRSHPAALFMLLAATLIAGCDDESEVSDGTDGGGTADDTTPSIDGGPGGQDGGNTSGIGGADTGNGTGDTDTGGTGDTGSTETTGGTGGDGGGDSDTTGATEPTGGDVGPTFYRDVYGLFQANCVGCHQAGGLAPFALDDYTSAVDFAAAIRDSVETRRMPPWQPSADCREYQGQRGLTDDEIALIKSWVDADTPEGNIADKPNVSPPPTLVEQFGPPDITTRMPDAYTPSTERPDDYHCFVMDAEFTADTFVRVIDVLPDQQALVHHVLVFQVPESDVQRVLDADSNEAGPGYTCFGGIGTPKADNVWAWVPGALPVPLPEDTGLRIVKGSRLVMQIHYNTTTLAPAADRTALEIYAHKTTPAYERGRLTLANRTLFIQPGETDATYTAELKNTSGAPVTVIATLPHMHMIGKTLTVRKTGPTGDQCLVDIPDWDFRWQQVYMMREDEEVVVGPSETVTLTCVYDNSAANQPIINGVPKTPAVVKIGEGTYDEMCLNYLWTRSPVGDASSSCPGFSACYDSCKAGSLSACYLQCVSLAGAACNPCATPKLLECTGDVCATEGPALAQCVQGCAGKNQLTCIQTNCKTQLAAYDACATAKVDSGGCNGDLAACGAAF